jgi:hypothetical protein
LLAQRPAFDQLELRGQGLAQVGRNFPDNHNFGLAGWRHGFLAISGKPAD